MRFAATGTILFGVFFNIALGYLEHLSYSDSGLGRQINFPHLGDVPVVTPRPYAWRIPRKISIRY